MMVNQSIGKIINLPNNAKKCLSSCFTYVDSRDIVWEISNISQVWNSNIKCCIGVLEFRIIAIEYYLG